MDHTSSARRAGPAAPLELRGKRVVLLLQGGGALGAYQVGAHRVLARACEHQGARIEWVGGISIGAVNAAVIAGNSRAPGDADRALRALWDDLLSWPFPPFDATPLARLAPPGRARLAAKWSNWAWTAFNLLGQRNFFTSRVLDPFRNPWLRQWWRRPMGRDELAFYDTAALRRTLDRHVDWAWLNGDDAPRLSLGAARVTSGEVVFFENRTRRDGTGRRRLRADHVLASGALPPAFPPIHVWDEGVDPAGAQDDAIYWDGGVSTNAPIQWLVHDIACGDDPRPAIVFLVDLWDRKGPMPQSMDEVCWRQKSIQYGSLKLAAESAVREHQLRLHRKPAAAPLEVCQLMYEWEDGDGPQFAFADADFSRATFRRMVGAGMRDMARALRRPERVLVNPDDLAHDGAVLYRYGTRHKHRATDPRPRP